MSLRLLHLTDTHLFADDAARLKGADTHDTLERVLRAALREATPDLVLVTGDVAHDASAAAYRRLAGLVAGLPAPVYTLPGNHDDPATLRASLAGTPVSCPAATRRGPWRLLFLDTTLSGGDGGVLGSARLAALAEHLQADPDSPTLLAMHHPPLAVGSPFLDAIALADAADLWALIEHHPQVRALLCGHVHREFQAVHRGRAVLATPSTCIQFADGEGRVVVDARPPAWRWLDLHPDGALTTRVGWLQPA